MLQGADAVLKHHQGSLTQALIDLFPELHLDPQKFITSNCFFGLLDVISNSIDFCCEGNPQRKFFDEFAQKKGFDPKVADGWKDVSLLDMLQQEVFSLFRTHCDGFLFFLHVLSLLFVCC
jgi:hypothetical protein